MVDLNKNPFSLNQELMAQEQGRIAQKIIEKQIKIISATFDKAMSYTRVVIIAGYASYFAMWSFTKEYLTDRQALWSALAMVLSVSTFVLFEVYQMYARGRFFMSWQKTLTNPEVRNDPQKLLAQLEDFDKNSQKKVVKQGKYWILNVYIAVLTGLTGIAILLYGFVIALIVMYVH